MSRPVVGNWARIRTDLSDGNKNAAGQGVWNTTRESFVGRIGIVTRVDSDNTVVIFFGASPSLGYFWRIAWITVLTPADVEKMDVRFVKTLRDECAKAHPGIIPPDTQAVVAKIKEIIGDVRGKLTELERTVAALE